MIKSLCTVLFALVAMALVAAPARAAASNDIRLAARLTASGATAKAVAKYEEKMTSSGLQQRFKVEIQNAKANSQFPVRHNGVLLGTITINSLGRGTLDLRVNGDDPGTSVPSLPHMKVGDTVAAGSLTGTFSSAQ